MFLPKVTQQSDCPALELAASWVLSRIGAKPESLNEVHRCFERNFWPFPKTLPIKDINRARELREKANKCYKKQPAELDAALRLYNESICYAPEGSEDLGLGYANRSAVYFTQKQYRKCFNNIQLAKANNYPRNKMDKLLQREERSLTLLQDCSTERKQSPLLEVDFCGVESDLQFVYNPGGGGGYIAKTDLQVGTVVLAERAAVLSIFPKSIYCKCSHCGIANGFDLIPCQICCDVMYCSEQCRTNAFNQYHRFECETVQDMKVLFKGTGLKEMFQLLLRLFWMAAGKLLDDAEDFSLQYKENLDRYRNPVEVEVSHLAFHVLATEESMLKEAQPNDIIIQQFFSILVYHILVEENDSFQNQRISYKNKSLLMEILYRLFTHVPRIYDERIVGATCFYPCIRMVNHSCVPNVEQCQLGRQRALLVKRPIKAGERMVQCYLFEYNTNRMPKKERQTMLQDKYRIFCQCLGCIMDYPQVSAMQENVVLRSELEAISEIKGEKNLRALEEFLQKYDNQYPLRALAIAWEMYRDRRVAELNARIRSTL
ncbi:uncharacterized protein LOC131691059 [Topomyia yanbarensis]|uniref:uncharacterized protein LOC131691059 n=1 Tax=Topomyia yanbarensis TaxID=2498891 RepID=UPI00273C1786|nr:uncharacterized protein LOC131691059 [Topomyia yanbarensis]